MKKGLKFLGCLGFGFIAVIIIGIIVAVSTDNDSPGTKTTPEQVTKEAPKIETSTPAPKEEPKEDENTFAFGTEVPFESGINTKVIGVTTTTERNQFADPTKYVVVVEMELTNTTASEMTITSNEFNVQDKDDFQGKTYPSGDQIVTIAPNGKAKAKFHYGVDGEGPYKVVGGVATWK
jgi:hypothetical protein